MHSNGRQISAEQVNVQDWRSRGGARGTLKGIQTNTTPKRGEITCTRMPLLTPCPVIFLENDLPRVGACLTERIQFPQKMQPIFGKSYFSVSWIIFITPFSLCGEWKSKQQACYTLFGSEQLPCILFYFLILVLVIKSWMNTLSVVLQPKTFTRKHPNFQCKLPTVVLLCIYALKLLLNHHSKTLWTVNLFQSWNSNATLA